MKRIAVTLVSACTFAVTAHAAELFSAHDAEALVGRVIKALATNREATLKEITAKDPKWVKGELYPVVETANPSAAMMVAHGAAEKLVGKDVTDLTDADGKLFNREFQEATMAKGKSWTDFKWKDPVTGKILPKTLYCEKGGDLIVCAGIYKR